MARSDAGPHWLNPVVMTTELIRFDEKSGSILMYYGVIIFMIFKKQYNYM